MTNFEKITQNEETLGKLIGKFIWCIDCPNLDECKEFAHSAGERETRCVPKIIQWLKQEVAEK